MKTRSIIVPPGGFLSIAGLPPASAGFGGARPRSTAPGMRASSRPKRRKSRTKAASRRAAPRRAAKRVKRGKPARLVKGSAAAKRYMAKIRRKRRR